MLLNVGIDGALFDGQESVLKGFITQAIISRFAPSVVVAPTGTALTIRVQDQTGAGPANFLEATIAAGSLTGTAVTGSLTIAPEAEFFLRVVTASAAASLAGYIELGPGLTAPAAGDLTTLAAVKSYLNQVGAAEDTLLQALVTSVSKAMQSYMRRTIGAHSVTEVLDGDGTSRLMLSEWPVISVTSAARESVFNNFGTVIPTSEIKLDKRGDHGVLIRNGTWPLGDQNLQIVYQAGLSAVPEDLELAAKKQTVYEFEKSGVRGARLALKSEILNTGGTASFVVTDWVTGVEHAMNPYKQTGNVLAQG